MQFDESYTEDEIEERSFRMVLPSEGHRQRAKKQDTQSDHGSLSSEDLHLTSGKPFSHQGIRYCQSFKIPQKFGFFYSYRVISSTYFKIPQKFLFFFLKSHQFNPFLPLPKESCSPIKVFIM